MGWTMMCRGWMIPLLCVFAISSAGAQTQTRTVFPSVAALGGYHGGSTPPQYVSVSCYYAGIPCSGGGPFDLTISCGSGNGATLIPDADGNCYRRDNFGTNGVVDARQCGVVGDGEPAGFSLPGGVTHPDDGAVLNNCLGYASGAGVPVVTTGGGVILDNTGGGNRSPPPTQ